MSVDSLLSRLEGVKRTAPDRWIAKCPSHKDRRASLSVRALDNGRVLVHCFAGCPVDLVVGAAGLQLQDLFPPRAPQQQYSRGEPRPFRAREAIFALQAELRVAWVLLGDLAEGKEMGAADRKRAGVARDRCQALIEELSLVQ